MVFRRCSSAVRHSSLLPALPFLIDFSLTWEGSEIIATFFTSRCRSLVPSLPKPRRFTLQRSISCETTRGGRSSLSSEVHNLSPICELSHPPSSAVQKLTTPPLDQRNGSQGRFRPGLLTLCLPRSSDHCSVDFISHTRRHTRGRATFTPRRRFAPTTQARSFSRGDGIRPTADGPLTRFGVGFDSRNPQ